MRERERKRKKKTEEEILKRIENRLFMTSSLNLPVSKHKHWTCFEAHVLVQDVASVCMLCIPLKKLSSSEEEEKQQAIGMLLSQSNDHVSVAACKPRLDGLCHLHTLNKTFTATASIC